jgi:hypothetical protein
MSDLVNKKIVNVATPTNNNDATNKLYVDSSINAFDQKIDISALDVFCNNSRTVYFAKTISTNSTFTFSNIPAAPNVYAFTLRIDHVSGTITWPASVKWPNGVAPTLTSPKTQFFFFQTDDGGTNWWASSLVGYTT